MTYVAFVFAIFGFMAYLEANSLKKRVDAIEAQLTKVKGTSYQEDRKSLLALIRANTGKKVTIDLKEDHGDADIMMYGNTKHGSNTILDADDEWMLVRIEGPKGVKEKLIRLESVVRIGVPGEDETES